MNAPWKYIKLSQVMASVKSDLNLYDDAGFIDSDRIIKIVAECNEKLGQRIYKSRDCKIVVTDYKAPSPADLYKIEKVFATAVHSIHHTDANFGAERLEFSVTRPKSQDWSNVITYGKIECGNDCGPNNCDKCYFASLRPEQPETTVIYTKIIPLSLSYSATNSCTEYSPCRNVRSDYKIDLDQREFTFNFKEGEICLSYLGDLVDEEGDLEIPFHPKLNSYYEYAIKEKIMEDMFINSEADVIGKLQYFAQKKRDAYVIAWEFVQSKRVGEWNNIQKKLRQEYFNKWYKGFN